MSHKQKLMALGQSKKIKDLSSRIDRIEDIDSGNDSVDFEDDGDHQIFKQGDYNTHPLQNDSQYQKLMRGVESSKKELKQKRQQQLQLENDIKYKGKKIKKTELEWGNQDEQDENQEKEIKENKSLFEKYNSNNKLNGQAQNNQKVNKKTEKLDNKLNNNKKINNQKIQEDEEEDEFDDEDIQLDDEDSITSLSNFEDEEDEKLAQKLKQIKKPIKNQQSSKKKSNLDDLEKQVDKIVDKIHDEDLEGQQRDLQDIKSQKEKATQLKKQIKIFKNIIQYKIGLQKPLELIKKFPKQSKFDYFIKEEQNVTQQLGLQALILDQIQQLQQIQKSYLNACDPTTNKDNFYSHNFISLLANSFNQNKQNLYDKKFEINSDLIYTSLENNFNAIFPYIDQNLSTWNQKTQILSQNYGKKTQINMHTPLGQAQKAMEQPEKLLTKTQLKRNNFRILGEGSEDVYNQTDANIYDDQDFHQELMKDFIELKGDDDEEGEAKEMDNLWESTQRHLMLRRLKFQERKLQNLDNIDRKSSKARKLRYHVHQKLVNFMNPINNSQLNQATVQFEARDEIVKNLTIIKQEQNNQEQNKQNNNDNIQEENDINII